MNVSNQVPMYIQFMKAEQCLELDMYDATTPLENCLKMVRITKTLERTYAKRFGESFVKRYF